MGICIRLVVVPGGWMIVVFGDRPNLPGCNAGVFVLYYEPPFKRSVYCVDGKRFEDMILNVLFVVHEMGEESRWRVVSGVYRVTIVKRIDL